MPSISKKQHNLMAMVANNPKAAKRVGIPQTVGAEFMKADKGKKYAAGGMFKGKETPAEERKEANALKAGKISKAQYVTGEKKEGHGGSAAKKADALKSGRLSVEKYAKEDGMKKGGKCCTKMARGGGIEVRGKTKGKLI